MGAHHLSCPKHFPASLCASINVRAPCVGLQVLQDLVPSPLASSPPLSPSSCDPAQSGSLAVLCTPPSLSSRGALHWLLLPLQHPHLSAGSFSSCGGSAKMSPPQRGLPRSLYLKGLPLPSNSLPRFPFSFSSKHLTTIRNDLIHVFVPCLPLLLTCKLHVRAESIYVILAVFSAEANGAYRHPQIFVN